MKLRTVMVRWVLPVIGVTASLALLAFLVTKTQAVDSEKHLKRLELMRTVNSLDAELNRVLAQERVSSLDAADETLTNTIAAIGATLEDMDKGEHNMRGLSPDLDVALNSFLDTLQDKSEVGYDFKLRSSQLNQRLVNSVTSVPDAADRVVAASSRQSRELVTEAISQLKAEITTFAVTPAPSNEPDIRALLTQLNAAAAQQPGAFADAVANLQQRCTEVIEGKTELVGKLNDFLNRPTAAKLQGVERAYADWHRSQVAIADNYRLVLVAYAVILLLLLTWVGVLLGRSLRTIFRANQALSQANEGLEAQVNLRTKDLSAALANLRASQTQLLQSEKMASLGQMVAGVAHEINTPLGYARSNAEIVRNSINDIRDVYTSVCHALKLLTTPEATDQQISDALTDAQAKMASTNAEELVDDLSNLLTDTDHGLTQIAELVIGLKDFSRVDRSRHDLFSVNDGLESALKIAHNQLKHKVEIVKQFNKLPNIECAPSQINQVFLNLITNAAQAIEGSGKIYLHTATEETGVAIRIIDNGSGMSEEVRARIFEPFFTTKAVGKGTGLGLSIVYRIIEDHNGRIEVRSTPGKGTEFSIHLPLKQPRQPKEASPEDDPALAAA